MSTEQQYLVTLNVDGYDFGIWDKATGGDLKLDDGKYRPGGMVPEKSYRALPTFNDLKLTRVLERDRDWENMRYLMNIAGQKRATVTVQPLDDDANAWGSPMVYQGRLGPTDPGDVDSQSSKPRMLGVTVFVETRA